MSVVESGGRLSGRVPLGPRVVEWNEILSRGRAPAGARPTPDARRPTPDARRPTPDARRPTPDARRPTPDARRPTPDARRPTPDARRPTPDARRPTPDARRPTPDARRPTPDARCPMPDARCPMPDARRPTPDARRAAARRARMVRGSPRAGVNPRGHGGQALLAPVSRAGFGRQFFVPNRRSPASPRPGTMYAWSSRCESSDAT
ncbi:hypothetical protein [Burkholderia pseudomallei]|uniref:hypothetical protein n=1 Tax=Burkholderia pseudomallei TaxID=28450 RepID=UPI0031333066